ncbi:hypothetical protein PtrM4_124410 [Pyrenophora tritici-repentis]|uniref:HTH CENPB-type domain-containing protein n=1 Tax=Pyrenophora tritici-repentis TaxID=45151 RepID=A0A834RPJ5_9PLEO|nr:hypothetical protein PtrM4_124410 [Pyrenophora tritici-repentis]
MDPIQEAIEFLESREAGNNFSYRQIAKMFGVELSTLVRRHQGKTQPRGTMHRLLHPQQEKELVEYIRGLSERRLPPTRTMIRNFASSLAGKEVSETWVSRFLRRHPSELISRYTSGMDRKRHKADSGAKYKLYFELLHAKMMEYGVQPTQIYNMDEKGFQIGCLGRSKRVFDKVLYDQKGVRACLQDSNTQ